jgi:hypothetical protein
MKHSYLAVLALPILGAAHAQTASCDRNCLAAMAEQYMQAFAKRDPSDLPVAATIKSAENSHSIALGENAWRTVVKVRPERMVFTDPEAGQVVRIGVFEMNAGQPFIYVLRLKVENHRITQSEMMVTSDNNAGQHFVPDTVTSFEPLLTQTLAPSDQPSRDDLIKVAKDFWTSSPDFKSTADCIHTENGGRIDAGGPPRPPARADIPAGGQPGGCPASRPVGNGSMFTALRGVRYALADTEHGVVITYALQDATPRPRTPPAGERTPIFYQRPVTFYALNLLKIDHGQAKREALFMNIQEANAPLPFAD